MSYTNYFFALMQDLQALLRTEFPNYPVLIGERVNIEQQPTIVIEPYSKSIDTEITNSKKVFDFELVVRVYGWEITDEDGAQRVTDISEQIEELIIDNKRNPADGTKWHNSIPVRIDYGQTNKNGSYLRTSEIRWRFAKIVNRV